MHRGSSQSGPRQLLVALGASEQALAHHCPYPPDPSRVVELSSMYAGPSHRTFAHQCPRLSDLTDRPLRQLRFLTHLRGLRLGPVSSSGAPKARALQNSGPSQVQGHIFVRSSGSRALQHSVRSQGSSCDLIGVPAWMPINPSRSSDCRQVSKMAPVACQCLASRCA